MSYRSTSHNLKTFLASFLVCGFIVFGAFESAYTQALQPTNTFVVVLDAGHGGKDPGNMGNGYKEKDIALKVVLKVGEALEKNPHIKVVYTRKNDVFIDLFKRGQIANKAHADLFVSVHCNSHNSSAHGTETFVLGTHRNNTNFQVAKKENSVIFLEDDYEKNYAGFDPNSPESLMSILISQEEYLDQSIMLASLIQKKFTHVLNRKDRGVKQAGFIVLHQTVMPSVLIEIGFLTYKKEGAYLNSNKGQQAISTAITKAILQYKNTVDYYATSSYVAADDENLTKEATNGIVFKVQIAASSKQLETKPYNFKGLEAISRHQVGGLYKYFYGETNSYSQIKQLESQAKNRGYTSSFVVAFKDGQKMKLSDALKTTTN